MKRGEEEEKNATNTAKPKKEETKRRMEEMCGIKRKSKKIKTNEMENGSKTKVSVFHFIHYIQLLFLSIS